MKALFCVALMLISLVTQAIDLGDLKVYEDTTLAPEVRISRLLELMAKEVAKPTTPHMGFAGGMINHDYTMAQIITALDLVASQSPTATTLLTKRIESEMLPEVSEAISIVLAQGGDASRSSDMIRILKSSRGRHVRTEAADALRTLYATPNARDLVHRLNDESVTPILLDLYGSRYGMGEGTTKASITLPDGK